MTTDQPEDRDGSEPASYRQPVSRSESPAAEEFRRQVAQTRPEPDDSDVEEQVWEGGYSPKAMFGIWLALALTSLISLVGILMTSPGLLGPVVGLLALGWGLAGVVYAWRRFGVHYELTTQRFIHQAGILTRRTDRIEVIDIDDVSFTQGPIERIFSVGTIVLTSSDRTHPVLSMIGIADVKEVAGRIDDIRRKERRRRSLHIEAI